MSTAGSAPTLGALRRATEAFRSGASSASARVEAALARLAAHDASVGAFLTVDGDGARATATRLDERRASGESVGALAGAVLAIKDNICTRGLRTTCGSRMLETFTPPFDATVVARLRAADAVILGKVNLDEFAMGSSTENSAFQPTRNPHALDRAPGGSSGGSAAAVAAGFCDGALGTDTGGSIRQPAAFCGVVGLKPTYGRVSRFGVVAFASSLDQVGPLAADVRGAATLLSVIAGPDPHDATSADAVPVPDPSTLAPGADLRGLRLGIPREYFPDEGLEPDVRARIEAAFEVLRGLGATLVPVSLPHTEHAISTYYLVATAEAASNLSRFDGVRYGHRATAPTDLRTLYGRSRAEGFGLEVVRRILLGTFALSAGYHDAYYGKASQVRTLIRRDFDAAFASVDALVTPTSPTTAFPLGARTADPLAMYLADVFTISCNLAGLPGLALPCGVDRQGLPVGLQLLGRPFDEATLLRVGAAYEDATGGPAPGPTAPFREVAR